MGNDGCFAQADKEACKGFEWENAGAGGGAGGNAGGSDQDTCMWIEQENAQCAPFDACRTFKKDTMCKKFGTNELKCKWQKDMQGGGGAGGQDGGFFCARDPEEAFAKETERCYNEVKKDACEKGGKVCLWTVKDASQCMDWKLCESRPDLASESTCKTKKGCLWVKDGSQSICMAAADTTVTTTTVTKTTVTTTTIFSCEEGKTRCGKARECKRSTWFCDGQPDCENGADEVGCPEATTTTQTTTTTTRTQTTTTTDTTTTTTATTTTTVTATTTTTVTTSTTLHRCVVDESCSTTKKVLNALSKDAEDIRYSTDVTCRVCATGSPVAELCAAMRTAGCPKKTVTLSPEEKKSAAKVVVYLNLGEAQLKEDKIQSAVEDYLKAEGVRATTVREVAVVVKSNGLAKVTIFTDATSGLVQQMNRDYKTFQLMIGKDKVRAYNGELFDHTNLDGKGNPTSKSKSGAEGKTNTGQLSVTPVDADATNSTVSNEGAEATASDGAEADPEVPSSGGKDDAKSTDGDSGNGDLVMVVVIIVILLFGGVAIATALWYKGRSQPGKSAAYANPTYEEPARNAGPPVQIKLAKAPASSGSPGPRKPTAVTTTAGWQTGAPPKQQPRVAQPAPPAPVRAQQAAPPVDDDSDSEADA